MDAATQRFHSRFPTDLDNEIELASDLYVAARMRYGERTPRVVRREPVRVWRRFRYFRAVVQDKPSVPKRHAPWALCHRGIDIGDDCKATAADILVPDNTKVWRRFVDRLSAELDAPDAAWRFAPAGRCHCGTSGVEFWPLASAELLRDLGFAVAETLATFLVFQGFHDTDIRDVVADIWRNYSPAGKRAVRQRNLLEGD